MHGLLLGTIVGGSSSLVIMPAMTRAQVEPAVANLVNLESAFTDAFCVVSASTLIDLMSGVNSNGTPEWALARSLGIGLAMGAGCGFLWMFLLRPLCKSDHAYPITLSALFILYVAIDKLGGSSALGILAFAVTVGNASSFGRRLGFSSDAALQPDVRGVHTQTAFIMKSFFFTFIGAMLGPPWSLIAMGILLGFGLLIARVPGSWIATLGSGLHPSQKGLVIVSMPRGMAAGVLATLPTAAGIVATDVLPTLVFSCVLTTILIFAVGFPMSRRGMPSFGEKASSVLAPPSPTLATTPPSTPSSHESPPS